MAKDKKQQQGKKQAEAAEPAAKSAPAKVQAEAPPADSKKGGKGKGKK